MARTIIVTMINRPDFIFILLNSYLQAHYHNNIIK